MSMGVNEGQRQGPALQSQTYLALSPCCVIWDKLLNLSEPRDLRSISGDNHPLSSRAFSEVNRQPGR